MNTINKLPLYGVTILICFSTTVISSWCPNGTYYGPIYWWPSMKLDRYDCLGCSAGSYCPGNQKMIPCPIGTYNPNMNASECLACEQKLGYQCAFTAMVNVTICPVGYYCPSMTTAIKCPKGQYSPDGGLYERCLNVSELNCTLGNYLTAIGKCQVCPKGSYCPNPLEDPIMCSAGTAQPSTGNTTGCEICRKGTYAGKGSEECESCKAGYYCPTTYDSPIACPSGTFNSFREKTDKSSCQPCPDGYYSESPGVGECSICWQGEYCPKKDRNSIKCPAGTFNAEKGKTNINDCKNCPKGNMSYEGAWECSECPKGSYCPNATQSVYCPKGTFQPEKSKTNLSDCLVCSKGFYSEKNGAVECSECPTGSYCPGNETKGLKLSCPSGTYQPGTGKWSNSSCIQCEQGFYSNYEGAEKCQTCRAGYYCNDSISEAPCPRGTFQNNTQSSDCLPCPQGYYSEYRGHALCDKWRDGFSCNATNCECLNSDCLEECKSENRRNRAGSSFGICIGAGILLAICSVLGCCPPWCPVTYSERVESRGLIFTEKVLVKTTTHHAMPECTRDCRDWARRKGFLYIMGTGAVIGAIAAITIWFKCPM